MRQKGSRPEQDPATAFLVRIGHSLLYVGMALMPITGILTMLGGGHGWSAFGIELVAEGGKIPWMASLGSLHSPIAWSLLILIVGHSGIALRSEEHTSELQSLMRISYAVFCLQKKIQ